MLHTRYDTQRCSIARSLEVVGERWTMLIVRNLLLGIRRFDELQAQLGIARNVLQARLARLTEEGIVERVPYQAHPPRHEYRLTEKGEDLWPVLHALLTWGDRYAAPPEGPPVRVLHRGCGGELDDRRRCERCGADVDVAEASRVAGPGAPPGWPPAQAA